MPTEPAAGAAAEPDPLTPRDLLFMQDRASIIVATRGADRTPHLMRALGCRIEREGRWVVVLLNRAQARTLVDDVADNSLIAVNFCRPTTDRSLQIKGDDARLVPVLAGDPDRLHAYREAMTEELAAIGYPRPYAQAMFALVGDGVVALGFTPREVYEQSPGPGAGVALAIAPAPTSSTTAGEHGSPVISARRIPRPRAAEVGSATAPNALVGQASATAAAADIDLASLRPSFEGATPSIIATCSADGIPNVTYVSQFEYVDTATAAASFQFFNKTRRNLLDTGIATLLLMDPYTAAFNRLTMRYLRTECEGPLFERMRARLASIASHTGMADVFKLRGADLFRIIDIDPVPGCPLARPAVGPRWLSGVYRISRRLQSCETLSDLWQTALDAIADELAIQHALLLLAPPENDRLYTVASHGYRDSGVGSETAFGSGVIGVCASVRVPIRLTHVTQERIYGDAIVAGHRPADTASLETRIPLPGLYQSGSRLAVPILAGDRLVGVLYVESPEEMRFTFETEEALSIIAHQLGWQMQVLSRAADGDAGENEDGAAATAHSGSVDAAPSQGTHAPRTAPANPPLSTLRIRFFDSDASVFIDDDYLIKGVAGAIFRALVAEYLHSGRTQFSNRELRRDPSLRLPDISDNLEARLALLARRLVDRDVPIRIERTGRGRFALRCDRPLALSVIG